MMATSPAAMMLAVRRLLGGLGRVIAGDDASHVPLRALVLGVTPAGPEVDYGWIVRGEQIGQAPAFAVRAFHEKPSPAIAHDLWRGGELWNTFISAGPAVAFWRLAQRHLPAHAARLAD